MYTNGRSQGRILIELAGSKIHIKDKLRLIPLSCLHLGAEGCDERRIKKLFNYILKKDECYVIGLGDYADLIIRQDSKRFEASGVKKSLQSKMDRLLNEQKDLVVRTFRPLAEKGKILGLGLGNHEHTIKVRHSYDFLREVCRELGDVPYLGYSFFYRLTVERAGHFRNVMIYGSHGWGSGRKPGSSMNKLVDSVANYDADIILSGHDHQKLGKRYVRIGMTQRGKYKMVHRPIILARAGTFLKTCVEGDDTYSSRMGYPPVDLGVVKIEITMTKADGLLDMHVSE